MTSSQSTISSLKYAIEHTPVGMLPQQYTNFQKLNVPETTSNEISTTLRNYEEHHLRQIPIEDSSFIISPHNKDSSNYYYDQTKHYKLQICPLSNNFDKLEKIADSSPLQKQLAKMIGDYLDKYFTKKNSSFNVYETNDNGEWRITVLIASHHINVEGMQNGEWIESYVITKKEENVYEVNGDVKVNTFCFEDSNTHFHLHENVKECVNAKDNQDLCTKVVEIIENKDNKIQTQLKDAFANFAVDYMKPLRRKIPLTGTKMKWTLNQLALK